MIKVYFLREMETEKQKGKLICHGIVSNKKVAKKFSSLKEEYVFYEFELDDPELLNRIAKEGK